MTPTVTPDTVAGAVVLPDSVTLVPRRKRRSSTTPTGSPSWHFAVICDSCRSLRNRTETTRPPERTREAWNPTAGLQ